jgi:hypothetical protein
MAVEGLFVLTSRHKPKETMDRLTAAVTARGASGVTRVGYNDPALACPAARGRGRQ